MCSSALANFFIEKANKEKVEMTNMKLQKLMFIGYGWTLALLDKDLTEGEGFQAWQHGPVLPSIYHEMKRFGNARLTEFATDYDNEQNKTYLPTIQNEDVMSILGKVWDVYKSFSAWSLRNLTHEKNSPWDQVYDKDTFYTSIDKDCTKQYYEAYISQLISSDCNG